MCGIIAYIGRKDCKDILINGLKRLEYRGYDSAGIGILESKNTKDAKGIKIKVAKEAGKIKMLEDMIGRSEMKGCTGIGHTRWATHGEPTKVNAHPHLDCKQEIAVVHNGIIENYAEIKEELIEKGHRFVSDTDTEVLPHLLEEYDEGDLQIAMSRLLARIKGSGAIVAISTKYPDQIIAGRIASPLIVGISKDANFFASDMPAVLEHTRDFLVINDYETVRITREKVQIFNISGEIVKRDPFRASWNIESAEKGGYEDFMLKEIFEQPYGAKETMRGRLGNGKLDFSELDLSDKQINQLNKIEIIACGTSYHAAIIGKQVIEKWAGIPVEVDFSSEYRYRDPVVMDNCLFIAITQSGETIDTLAAIREAKSRGAKIIAITNVVGSSVARESDYVLYTHAGPEIGVCATKTFTAQIMIMYMLGLFLAKKRKSLEKARFSEIASELEIMPNKISDILDNADKLKKIADQTYRQTCFLFLGRIFGFPVALEGALKLKEISYIHAEGYPAGEMKHGPIALTDKKTVVVSIIPKDFIYEKMLSNITEVKARKAIIFSLASKKDKKIEELSDHIFYIPETIEELYGILAIIPIQLYSYYIAKNLDRNVDQPRNLAKSVTVE